MTTCEARWAACELVDFWGRPLKYDGGECQSYYGHDRVRRASMWCRRLPAVAWCLDNYNYRGTGHESVR